MAFKTTLEIYYEGKNISTHLAGSALGFTYTDNAGGKVDDISFSLHDIDQKWISKWWPIKGDKIRPIIRKHDLSTGTVSSVRSRTQMRARSGLSSRPSATWAVSSTSMGW